jgi:hypothetical protein
MERWQILLKEGDPVARDPALLPDDVDRIRRRVLAVEPRARSLGRIMAIAFAAAVALIVGTGAWWTRATAPARPEPAAVSGSNAAASVRRQVQFSTPGGTRVIWIFDSNFDVR